MTSVNKWHNFFLKNVINIDIKCTSCDNDAEIFHDEGDFCVYSVGIKLKKHHKRRSAIVFTDNFRIGDIDNR